MRKTWLALPLALAFLVPTFFSAYSAEKITVGGACSSDMNAADWDTIMQCVSNQWKRGPYFFGSTSDACNAANKGLLQWTGTDFKACTDGVNWSAFGSSSTVTLGTATGSTNPQRSGDATTGLVSLTATSVGVVIAGAEQMRVTSGGVGIGTTGPAGKLDVRGGRTFLFANSEQYGLGVAYSTAGGSVYFGADSSSVTPNAVISNAAGTTLMTLQFGGNVGIGTSTINAKLDVNGGVKIGNDADSCSSTKSGTLKWSGYILSLCDGSQWRTIYTSCSYGRGSSTFTASGTFTPPSWVSANCPVELSVLVIGGGGGGGGGASTANRGAGGGSGYITVGTVVLTSTTGITVTVGAGGAGGTTTNNGSPGGSSSFGAYLTASGGSGGGSYSTKVGGNGGSGGGAGGVSSATCGDGGTGGTDGTAAGYGSGGTGQGALSFSNANIGYTTVYPSLVLTGTDSVGGAISGTADGGVTVSINDGILSNTLFKAISFSALTGGSGGTTAYTRGRGYGAGGGGAYYGGGGGSTLSTGTLVYAGYGSSSTGGVGKDGYVLVTWGQ